MSDIYIRNFRPNSDTTSNRVASFEVQYGPITIKNVSLIKSSNGGSFISMPSIKSDTNDKWYDQVEIDENMKLDIKNKLRQLVTAHKTRPADPDVPDMIDEDIPF